MPKRAPERDRKLVYDDEDSTHDMLIKAYLEYYKHNEDFEKRRSFRTYRHARRWLREVQSLSVIRQKEIITSYKATKHLNARKPKSDSGNNT
jgi:hypothetical protein